jgi:hypothetical protein
MKFRFKTSSDPPYTCETVRLDRFLFEFQSALQQGHEIEALWMVFLGAGVLVAPSEFQPLLSWLSTTTTLVEAVIIGDRRLSTLAVLPWILRALMDRPPTLPRLSSLTLSGIELRAADFALLLEACRPYCFAFASSTILTLPTFPTDMADMGHVTSALRGTSMTMEYIIFKCH